MDQKSGNASLNLKYGKFMDNIISQNARFWNRKKIDHNTWRSTMNTGENCPALTEAMRYFDFIQIITGGHWKKIQSGNTKVCDRMISVLFAKIDFCGREGADSLLTSFVELQ